MNQYRLHSNLARVALVVGSIAFIGAGLYILQQYRRVSAMADAVNGSALTPMGATVARNAAISRIEAREAVRLTLEQAGKHCSESPEQLRRMVSHHPEVIGADSFPVPRFLLGLRRGIAGHDPRQSCAGIVDSVATAMATQPR
jgi:hypothetical protein